MKSAIFLMLILGMVSCLSTSDKEKLKSFSIDGKWLPNDFHTSYLSLNFGKEAVFDNVGDTINVFTYHVDYPMRILWLTDSFNETRSANILKLDSDSLVFNHLWDLKTIQRFHRSNKK